MIYLNLSLDNPFDDTSKGGDQKDLVFFEKSLSKNKALDFQISYDAKLFTILGFTLKFDFRGDDHAEFRIHIHVLKLFLSLDIHDKRHWNYEKNRWMLDGEYE